MKKLLNILLLYGSFFSLSHAWNLDKQSEAGKQYHISERLLLAEKYFCFNPQTGAIVHKDCLKYLTNVEKFEQEVNKRNWWNNEEACKAIETMIYEMAATGVIFGKDVMRKQYTIVIARELHGIANPKGLFKALRNYINDHQSNIQLLKALADCGCDIEQFLDQLKRSSLN